MWWKRRSEPADSGAEVVFRIRTPIEEETFSDMVEAAMYQLLLEGNEPVVSTLFSATPARRC